MPAPPRRSMPLPLLGRRLGVLALVALVAGASGALVARVPAVLAAGPGADTATTGAGMGLGGAVVLGLVEGITEFLPVSSTGHLAVVQDLLGIGTASAQEKEAADAYAVVIQAGAILAVVVLYWGRLLSLARGLVGRDEAGRRVLIGTVIAVVPIGVVGLALESEIKERLFGIGPVIAAWAVGGIVLLLLSRWGWWGGSRPGEPELHDGVQLGEVSPGTASAGLQAARRRRLAPRAGAGVPLDLITPAQAAVIGGVQVLALWPGTSRSLVTIVAGLAIGLSLAAAVEFSFLVGLVTLGSATLVDGARHGGLIVDAFGWTDPVVGFVVAFVSAVAAVRWMVSYLQRHSLAVFGWYRLAVAGVVGVLWWRGVV